MVGHTGQRGIVPGLVLNVPCPLGSGGLPCRLRHPSHFWAPCAVLSLLPLRAAVWEGRSGSPDACGRRALEHRKGRSVAVRGLLAGRAMWDFCLSAPSPSEDPGWRKSQQALCFLFLAAAGSCSHICSCSSCCASPSSRLFSLLPAMYTLNSSTDTRAHCLLSSLPGPLVSR